MTHSSTVTLSLGSESITISGPASDQPIEPLAQYVTDIAQNGTRYSYRMSSGENRTWSLQLDFLTTEEKDDLESFYHDVVGGPSETFTWLHTDGNSYTARFINTNLPWQRVFSNLWKVALQIEILDTID